MEDYIREETKRLRRENIERVRLAEKENIREMSLSIESKDKK